MKLYDPWRDPSRLFPMPNPYFIGGWEGGWGVSDSRYKFRLTSFASLTSPTHPPNRANFHILVGGSERFSSARQSHSIPGMDFGWGWDVLIFTFFACLLDLLTTNPLQTKLPCLNFTFFCSKEKLFFLRNAQNVPQSIDRGKTDPTSIGNKKSNFPQISVAQKKNARDSISAQIYSHSELRLQIKAHGVVKRDVVPSNERMAEN